MRLSADKMKSRIDVIICKGCGAKYEKLPAFTCPRCGLPLCPSGCDGCKSSCSLKK